MAYQSCLRTALRIALEAVAAPMDVIVDSIIVAYAADRSVLASYVRGESARLAAEIDERRKRLAAEIDERQKRKTEMDALATMARYPSIVSDEWLQAVVNGIDRPPAYASIEYSGRYDNFRLSVDGFDVLFAGCPTSSQFRLSRFGQSWPTVVDFLNSVGLPAERNRLLRLWSTSEQIDMSLARQLFDNNLSYVPVVVDCYCRLMAIVARSGCLSSTPDCDGCRRYDWSAGKVGLRSFPAELYDSV
jgi:hypothetical protein